MGSPAPAGIVVVSVPARAENVHVIRAVTASVASRVPISFDGIEDLKLAVDEASARLLAVGASANTLQLRIEAFDDRLEATASVDVVVGSWPPPGIEDTFSWRVMSALVDVVTLDVDAGFPTIRMTKSRLEPRVPSEAP